MKASIKLVGVLAAALLVSCAGGPGQDKKADKELLTYTAYARLTVQGVTFSIDQVKFTEGATMMRVRIKNQSGAYFDFDETPEYAQLISGVGRMSIVQADRALWDNEKWGAHQPPNTQTEGMLT